MIVTLKSDNRTISVDTIGGELISYIDQNGLERLWNGDKSIWAGHSPILFPIIGTVENGEYTYNGKSYSITKHGVLRNREFSLLSQDNTSVTLESNSDEKTLAMYPFKYSFRVRHEVKESGFTTTFEVENRDQKELFFSVGGHPSFSCPLYDNEEFSDYYIEAEGLSRTRALEICGDDPINRNKVNSFFAKEDKIPLSYSLLDDKVILLEEIEAKELTLKSNNHTKSMRITFEDFRNIALWTFGSKQARYICIEPWNGIPAIEKESGKIEEKPYIISLKPAEKQIFSFSVDFSL